MANPISCTLLPDLWRHLVDRLSLSPSSTQWVVRSLSRKLVWTLAQSVARLFVSSTLRALDHSLARAPGNQKRKLRARKHVSLDEPRRWNWLEPWIGYNVAVKAL